MASKPEIFYLGFYAQESDPIKRFCNVAAIRKMDYTRHALSAFGFHVNLISLGWVTDSMHILRPKKVNLDEDTTLFLAPGFILKGFLSAQVNAFIAKVWFVVCCLIKIPRGAKVMVYHSPKLYGVLNAIKRFKKISYVLEIGEIYGDVWDISDKEAEAEKKLINLCDYFIPVSKELFYQLGSRAAFLMHGSYRMQLRDKKWLTNSATKKILYAGSIDKTKAGAFTAAEIMMYLPGNYRMYIAGYGSAEELVTLNKRIAEINSEKGESRVTYIGNLKEAEMNHWMNECQIAINPQNPGPYMHTAFPSKVLVYLSYMLNVVSTSIESVRDSEIAQLLHFVEGNNPEIFAEQIMKLDGNHLSQIPLVIDKLDSEFKENLKNLLAS